MIQHKLNLERYAQIARQAVAESCVLLKNENETLPLRTEDKVAVFGRGAFNYYKSGLGSGGLVNTRYVVSILDALKECDSITLEGSILNIYEQWINENPVDEGHGWGTVPWSQKEMPLTDDIIQKGKAADVAIVIIGRTAGEDQDNKNEEGSYLLTQIEKDMISKVCREFKRTIVLLNVGNIIDMKWVEEYNPSAVMYVWQGGQEGGNGVLDVLLGKVNPCGKLTDTIAYNIEDYPSSANFGDKKKNYYKEDIYVGYRYFETCAKDKVQYPFGFGLSYTKFDISAGIKEIENDKIKISVKVKNTGKSAGKEVIQVYVEAPQGKLGKPIRVLAGFAKTGVIQPEKEEEMTIDCPKSYFASYDDAGVSGNKSCLLLEEGDYKFYVGSDVRSAAYCGSFLQEEEVLEQLDEACAPIEEFERYKLLKVKDGIYQIGMEPVPLRSIKPIDKINSLREEEIAYTGNQGYCLGDVFDGRITMDQFIAQLSDEDLMYIFRGEGMCSPKVTPGTAAAFGGVTESLRSLGIPVACCADGPSGIRMDCGTKAFSIPNGTALGCTYNLELVKELFQMVGLELRKNKIDTLLGPGINIHRNPLNGRNFEYISEDPVLTGKLCVAQLNGMHDAGVTGTIKHFSTNNQEEGRCFTDAVVSERALREIYLKVFEIGVKEGNAKSIMTTYGSINGIWTAGNFDLCTVVLRKNWGYDGIVMTDWWATANWEGEIAEKSNRAPMVIAQNDLYMCCDDSRQETEIDNVREKLQNGEIMRYDLQRNAKNILNFIMGSPVMLRELGRISEDELDEAEQDDDFAFDNMHIFDIDNTTGKIIIDKSDMDFSGNEINFGITTIDNGEYRMSIEVKSNLGEMAQIPISVYVDNIYRGTISFQGTGGEYVQKTGNLGHIIGRNHYIKIISRGNGLEINRIMISQEVSER